MEVEKGRTVVYRILNDAFKVNRGLEYGITELRFVSEEDTITHSTAPLSWKDLILLPTYMVKGNAKIRIDRIRYSDRWQPLLNTECQHNKNGQSQAAELELVVQVTCRTLDRSLI